MMCPSDQPMQFEGMPRPADADAGLGSDQSRVALVHILKPEFHGFNPEDFADIPEEAVANASAFELQGSLYWSYVRKGKRTEEEVSTFSYPTPDGGFVSVALTPREYSDASESVDKLAQRRFNTVLAQRDVKLGEETGDDSARARTEEDIRVAKRGGVRAVLARQASMQELLSKKILPKVKLIDKFIEMTEGRNPNLARGTQESVSKRIEELRTTVFDDMLDAVALQRGWTPVMTERAKRVILKRLYISGTSSERIANFNEMLVLAREYYGHKRALILTKLYEANQYLRMNQEVVADIIAVDEQRRQEKETRQLQIEYGE